MCCFHVTQALKKTGQAKLFNKENMSLIMEDFALVYNNTHVGIKNLAVELFVEKWRAANETAFVEYFLEQWAPCMWSRAEAGVGFPITNAIVEVWNREFKRHVSGVRNLTVQIQKTGEALQSDGQARGPYEVDVAIPRQMWRDAQVRFRRGLHKLTYRRVQGSQTILNELDGESIEDKVRSMAEGAALYLRLRSRPSEFSDLLETPLNFDSLQVHDFH